MMKDLAVVLADATAVRVTEVVHFDARNRSATRSLLIASDSAALAQFREALAIDEASLGEQFAMMTPGVLALHVFCGHELRATVTYLSPTFVRWGGWPFDARLREPQRLAKWLTDRGWSGRGAEFRPTSSQNPMAEQVSNQGEEVLRSIRDARLTSVQFVLDYLILGFDEKGALTTLVWPEVRKEGVILTFGTPSYRNEMCALITQVVSDVEISNDETIRVTFSDKGQLVIPLRSYKGSGERAIFTGPKHVLFTW